jgi:hypothetical protein
MTINRCQLAIAAVVLQIALGAVSAWSVFSVPLSKKFGWSISEVTLTFTICIFVLGFASFFGGLWLSHRGPRVVAATGGLLYGAGLFLASFSNHGLWWLYFSHGVIVGIAWILQHRSYRGSCQVVSGPQRSDDWHSRWGIRSRRGYRCSPGNASNPDGRSPADVCLSWDRVSHRNRWLWLLHAKPAGRMETGRLDTNGLGGIKSIRARLLPRGSSQDLAVVGALATAFSQYFGRHLGDFA